MLAAAAAVPRLHQRAPGRERPHHPRPHLEGADPAEGGVAGAGRVPIGLGARLSELGRAVQAPAGQQASRPVVPRCLHRCHGRDCWRLLLRQGAPKPEAAAAADSGGRGASATAGAGAPRRRKLVRGTGHFAVYIPPSAGAITDVAIFVRLCSI